MVETHETDEQKVAAETQAAETKVAEEKVATEKTAEEKAASESDAAVEKLGKDFDKKVDDGDEPTADTDTDEEKEAKEKAEADAKIKADEEASEKDPDKEVDESLLERAEQAGISKEKAGEFGSKEDLERTVVLLEESQSEARAKKEQTPEELETEKKAKEEAEAKVKEDEAPYECKLDPEDYDEGFIKAVDELGTFFKKRIVALEAGQSKHAETLVSDRMNKHTDWLDSRINRMSNLEVKEVYGEGDIDDLESGSEQFKARATLDTKITKIATDLRQAKKTVPSRNKLFDMAIESLHKGKSTTKADAKTKAKLTERVKQSVGPGSSKVSAENAEAKALQVNKDFDKEIDDED